MIRSLAGPGAALVLLAAAGLSAGGGPPVLHGTLGGEDFVPVDSSALVLGEATCSFLGARASAAGLGLGFGSFPGMCGLATETRRCGKKARATVVSLLLVRANVAGGPAGAVGPGTYAVGEGDPAPDAAGSFTVAQAFVSRTDDACAEPAGRRIATAGTIRIDAVGERVTGAADLVFDDGSRVAGRFDAPACALRTDVCSALSGAGCDSPRCVP
jgi:hypothetical protein